MKAIAIRPGQPASIHLAELPRPQVSEVRDGKGILVRVLKVGVDATDREIYEAKYGNAPPGFDFLVMGHESFGVVEEVGPAVRSVKSGDFVTATVRRPGNSIYDLIGTYDMTSEETYYERGINLLHGYLTEYYVDHEEYIVRVPAGLKHLHVLMEPMSIAAKAVAQAYEAQRRLRVWRPQRAFVMGAGQIGLLASMVCRLRGLEVYTIARSLPGTLSSRIVQGMEASYVSTTQVPLPDLVKQVGKPDLIIEASGNSAVAFQSMQYLNLNGVLMWTSVTGGEHKTELPTDKINLEWVLGNKMLMGTVNANREYFEAGIRDFALAEVLYPGVMQQILTSPVEGLDGYAEMMRLLCEDKSALKVYVNVAAE